MFEQEQRPNAYLGRWFFGSGLGGIAVAAVLTALMIHDLVPTKVTLALWPSSIAGIADPHTVAEKLLVAAVTFGGQFFLYGIIGLLFAFVINVVRSFMSRR